MPIRILLAFALAANAFDAFATPQHQNMTDMWFNPAESGWGLNLIHQGDTLFATLFVHGPDGQPRWYVASSLVGGDDGPFHDRAAVYNGTLRECLGPPFAGAFNVHPVTCRDVGPMRVERGNTRVTLDYTVDGVRVVKPELQRFSFRNTNLTGTYVGSRYKPGPQSTVGYEMTAIAIQDDGASVTMSTQGDAGPCTWTGTHVQDGQYQAVAGQFTCGARSRGPWFMHVDPTPAGFTGQFGGDGVEGPWGRIVASRRDSYQYRGNGWRNDMWFNPAESGWGFNVIEQGDNGNFTLFGTLFVYDAQGLPRWYVASDLARHDIAGDWVYYLGGLYETTGPWFGAAFNPAAVTRRRAGSVSFQTHTDNRPATLIYDVDSTRVEKTVSRFAFDRNDFSGSYQGHLHREGDHSVEALTFNIVDGANFTMQAVAAGGAMWCDYVAPFSQVGHMRVMTGTYNCSNGTSGSFSMTNAIVSFHGFTARMVSDGVNVGNLEGARREEN